MTITEHIKRIREALADPRLAEMGDWYSPEDDRNPLCDAALIAACSPEAMRAILDELADRERRIESALAERNRLGVELEGARIRLVDMAVEVAENKHRWRSLAQPLCAELKLDAAWDGPGKILAEVLAALAERDKVAAELAKTRAYYATSQSHAADIGEALRAAQDERDRLAAELQSAAHNGTADGSLVTLCAAQLRHALEFAAPDFDADVEQHGVEVTIGWREVGAGIDDDGNPEPAGYVAWLSDYPEEGCIPLLETWGAPRRHEAHLAAELEQERAQRITLQHHAADQSEAPRVETEGRKPLTEDEIFAMPGLPADYYMPDTIEIVRAIERAHGITDGGAA